MSNTHEINDRNEVVPYTSGRRCNDTRARRDATEFELQMKSEIEELTRERDILLADLDFRRELYEILAERCDRHTAQLAQMTVNRNGLDDALNELWHYHSLTGASYELIERAREEYGNTSSANAAAHPPADKQTTIDL